MLSKEKINALIASIDLNHQALREREHLLGWQADDPLHLSEAAHTIQQAQSDFIQQLDAHFASFPEAVQQLKTVANTESLQLKQAWDNQQLWQNIHNDDYIRQQLQVGLEYQSADLTPLWYLSTQRLYLDTMLKALCSEPRQIQQFSSLIKAVFLDMSLVLEGYCAAHKQQLKENQARFERTMYGANDGLWEWDIANDQLLLSSRWLEMLELSAEEFGSHNSGNWFARMHPEDLPLVRKALGKHLSGHSKFLDCEYRIRKKNGDYIWVLLRGFANKTQMGRQLLSGSQADIHERKEQQQNMTYAAFHDPLTGLANRRRLDQLLQDSMQRTQQAGTRETALLFIDLDNFKQVNDNYGHKSGDYLLIEIANRLQKCLRPGDHIARFGGDEFVVLLDDLACLKDAEHVAQRMLDSLSSALRINGYILSVSASIGITVLPHDTPASELLQAADLALYQAKMAGKAQFAHYTQDMQAAAQALQSKQAALTQGLSNQQFEVLYQPIYNLSQDSEQNSSSIYAVEALLRWHHDGHCYRPQNFLDLLEQSDEILAVGAWVLKSACAAVRQWQQSFMPQLHCSVNLSYKQLRSAHLVSLVKTALESSGLAASYLIIEIAENHLKPECSQSLANLRELSMMGIQIALDNFGMGHAPLGYLKRFPLDIIKVDKSLISHSLKDSLNKDIGQAIISLGHSLNLKVIAEGIESPYQLSFVKGRQCEFAQGYLLSDPLSAEQFTTLISSRS
ncbi:EAL domain-containing protein [Denitrificimonas caeni]|uniref:EAL domain-containing protein n=1 Tax=Denitrificimonas caeni TaxID=521720 RepID=UPI0019650F00|nr:EAL domain-containing protein [Denitrificimonas caeni]